MMYEAYQALQVKSKLFPLGIGIFALSNPIAPRRTIRLLTAAFALQKSQT